MKAAIAALETQLDILTTNESISRAQGDIAQADLEAAVAKDIRKALVCLRPFEEVPHTPEPWFTHGDPEIFVLDPNDSHPDAGISVATTCVSDEISAAQQTANAQRVVACVNACKGIRNPAKVISALQASAGALEDLLDQLAGVGIYVQGENAGQWNGAEGLSFQKAEKASDQLEAATAGE